MARGSRFLENNTKIARNIPREAGRQSASASCGFFAQARAEEKCHWRDARAAQRAGRKSDPCSIGQARAEEKCH